MIGPSHVGGDAQMSDDRPEPPPAGAGYILLAVVGGLLLLPGICSVLVGVWLGGLSGAPDSIRFIWLSGFIIGAVGIALIASAIGRARQR